MDPVVATLSLLLLLAAAVILWLTRERYRLTAERDLARARGTDAEQMSVQFQAMAGQALRASNSEFLRLAQETLAAREATSLGALDERRRAVDELIRPIEKAIQRTHEQLQASAREQHGLTEQVKGVAASNRELRAETGRLSQALRKPNVRGRYGEVQLERVVELAGMRSYCDFTSQSVLRSKEGAVQRPDLLVSLPNGRNVAVDAKMPLDAYMDALEATTDEQREAHLSRYADAVLAEVKKLAGREYWSHFEDSVDLVVMFLPGDQLVDAALERRGDLIDVAIQSKVVLASPSTLVGLLRAIHVGWRERNLTDNAQELLDLGREFHLRASTVLAHAGKLGESIERSRREYNQFVGSLESRLLPTLRKFEERGAGSAKELTPLSAIEGVTRELGRNDSDAPSEGAAPLPQSKAPGPGTTPRDSSHVEPAPTPRN